MCLYDGDGGRRGNKTPPPPPPLPSPTPVTYSLRIHLQSELARYFHRRYIRASDKRCMITRSKQRRLCLFQKRRYFIFFSISLSVCTGDSLRLLLRALRSIIDIKVNSVCLFFGCSWSRNARNGPNRRRLNRQTHNQVGVEECDLR